MINTQSTDSKGGAGYSMDEERYIRSQLSKSNQPLFAAGGFAICKIEVEK